MSSTLWSKKKQSVDNTLVRQRAEKENLLYGRSFSRMSKKSESNLIII